MRKFGMLNASLDLRRFARLSRIVSTPLVKKSYLLPGLLLFAIVCHGVADTIILRSGTSYSGESDIRTIGFSDSQGISYQFPVRDVQSLAFGSGSDTIVLRSGRSYTGHFTGSSPVSFQDSQGIRYQFPTSDIDAIVFNGARAGAPPSEGSLVIPIGADVSVRTNERIDSNKSYEGQTYSATITDEIRDIDGKVAIPAGSPARLLVRKISGGGVAHSPEVVLDLYSITVDHKAYRVASTDLAETNKKGIGKNGRTAEFLGGGSALGALLGGVFGGGKGAGIGALAGAGSGFVTQAFTRGKQVQVPAESVLRFRLEKTLVLQPGS